MSHKVTFLFNDAAANSPTPGGLTLAIRTDARHATAGLKQNLTAYLESRHATDGETKGRIEKVVHGAYGKWGHTVLQSLADCLDYKRYGLMRPEDQNVTVHFYNARELAGKAITGADKLLTQDDRQKQLPLVRISLDDMIDEPDGYWGEIGFSRLFGLQGDQQPGYLARPGKKPLVDQVKDIADLLAALKAQYHEDIPFVLLEDNVRHARMLNWVIELLEQNHVFEHGKLAGISTCFCCASAEELAKIQHRGKPVPVQAVVDYKDSLVDVVTPRDLLFDGYVVEVKDKPTRLPAIFMDVQKLFKIDPQRADEFAERARLANATFCDEIQEKLGVPVPVAWFTGADAISFVTGAAPDDPMSHVLRAAMKPAANLPPPQFGT